MFSKKVLARFMIPDSLLNEWRHGMKLWIAAMLLTLTVPCLTTAERKGMYVMETLTFSSPAFNHGEAIPPRYGCDGADASPFSCHRRNSGDGSEHRI